MSCSWLTVSKPQGYQVESIEDPFEEESFELFAELTVKMPRKIIIGDDLFVTNVKRLQEGIKKIVGHRSGKTEDMFIADLSVVVNAERHCRIF